MIKGFAIFLSANKSTIIEGDLVGITSSLIKQRKPFRIKGIKMFFEILKGEGGFISSKSKRPLRGVIRETDKKGEVSVFARGTKKGRIIIGAKVQLRGGWYSRKITIKVD